MIIIAGYTRVTEVAERDAGVAAFADMIARARAQEGCLDFAISADAVEPDRVNLFECWRDQAALDAWRKVARGPRGRSKPKEVNVKLYRSEKAEKPF